MFQITQTLTKGGDWLKTSSRLFCMPPPNQQSPIGVIRGNNHVPIWWGVSSEDGYTLVPIEIDETSGGVKIEDGVTVMPVMSNLQVFLERDANQIPCIGGQSDANAQTVIPVSVNPLTGAIQVQST